MCVCVYTHTHNAQYHTERGFYDYCSLYLTTKTQAVITYMTTRILQHTLHVCCSKYYYNLHICSAIIKVITLL